MIPTLPYDQCTGCSSCVSTCPKNAISLSDDVGFFHPIVDGSACIGCNQCLKACHVLADIKKEKPLRCVAAMAADDIRLRSSSGGAFYNIAKWVIEKGGVVYAAAFDKGFRVQHIRADSLEKVHSQMQSKYYQSYLGHTFRKIKTDLEDGVLVCFVGCPCQVSGLKKYLKKGYVNLVTVDLVCHGISSKKIFDCYLMDIHNSKKIATLSFKNKKPWGWRPSMQLTFTDKSSYLKPADQDLFFNNYLNGLCMVPCCGTCRYCSIERMGDLTIGDFWGIDKFDSKYNDDHGTSLILASSKMGMFVLNEISSSFIKFIDVPIKYAISGNRSFRCNFCNPKNKRIFEEYQYISFHRLIKSVVNDYYDVGIVIENYCSNFQSLFIYCLYQAIERSGYTCAIIPRGHCFIDNFNFNVVSCSHIINYKFDLILASFDWLNCLSTDLLLHFAKKKNVLCFNMLSSDFICDDNYQNELNIKRYVSVDFNQKISTSSIENNSSIHAVLLIFIETPIEITNLINESKSSIEFFSVSCIHDSFFEEYLERADIVVSDSHVILNLCQGLGKVVGYYFNGVWVKDDFSFVFEKRQEQLLSKYNIYLIKYTSILISLNRVKSEISNYLVRGVNSIEYTTNDGAPYMYYDILNDFGFLSDPITINFLKKSAKAGDNDANAILCLLSEPSDILKIEKTKQALISAGKQNPRWWREFIKFKNEYLNK